MVLCYDVLEETQKEIEKMLFWKEVIEINPEEYEVIHDYEQACENAFDAFFVYEGEEGLSWVDILENNMSKLWKSVFEADNYSELCKSINAIRIPNINVNDRIKDFDIVDEMEYELILCSKSRFICGKNNAFFEKVFKAYRIGAWPCGWENGKIIVYVPEHD